MLKAAARRNWTTIWAVRKAGATAAALALALAAAQPAHAASDPAPVAAAERAFAADGLALGIKDSFLKHAAPEAIVLNPEPQLARAVYGAAAASKTRLVWWPLWAGIAKSGDLGFTTGPYTVNGEPGAWYFTVWARQPDGGWKWLLDAGPPSDPAGAAPQGSAVAYARPSGRSAGSPAKAMAQVARAEAGLAAAARSDAKAAYLAIVAGDGRVVGSKSKPPASRAELEAELATRPQAISFSPLGGLASSAGDLAWTYGMAAWTADGKAGRGHYVRIWRNDARGWRLLFDELLPLPPRS
ncbi:MAG: hypothetical protein JWP86_1282 [Phenylobacterium sp.]|nr:hypothetical protein [Phenylobacterium sp.]